MKHRPTASKVRPFLATKPDWEDVYDRLTREVRGWPAFAGHDEVLEAGIDADGQYPRPAWIAVAECGLARRGPRIQHRQAGGIERTRVTRGNGEPVRGGERGAEAPSSPPPPNPFHCSR